MPRVCSTWEHWVGEEPPKLRHTQVGIFLKADRRMERALLIRHSAPRARQLSTALANDWRQFVFIFS